MTHRARQPRIHPVESRQLPSGTVTMLFTDIEGSTRLLKRLGDRYGDALRTHRRLLREALGRHGGVEVDTQGDAFFYAFPTAHAAVAAAQEGQAALTGSEVRVRMGLHSGEPAVMDTGYVGIDVHRAARICAAARGGQVLLSDTTAHLVDADLKDLGEHRLKDFEGRQRLFQLGQEEFPSPRVSTSTNLPAPPTALVGRERERKEVGKLLRDHRVVTLVGPGGIGKTRLSLEVAGEAAGQFGDGIFWVPLAAVGDPDLVEQGVARALGIQGSLVDHVAGRELLLLLDNFEQVVEAALHLAKLLGSSPRLKLLVTSREPLRIAGEWVYTVPSLTESESVALFAERATAVRGDFEPDEAVNQICRRLDGLPLALELAAARVKALSPAQILGRLGKRLDLLTAGARDLPARQRTLRATVDWSCDLLAPGERDLFARLGVFSGGWTLEVAETVCDTGLDALEALVDKSLVTQAGERFAMLETIRECAVERMDRLSQRENPRRRHALFFLAFAEDAAAKLEGSEQEAWIRRLDDEHDNIRAALDHFAQSGDSQFELRMVAAIWSFWFTRGLWEESRGVVTRAVSARSGATTPALVAVMHGAAWTAWRLGDEAAAKDLAEESLRLGRELGDARLIGRSLAILAVCLEEQSPERARALLEESWDLYESVGDLNGISRAANNLSLAAAAQGEYRRAAGGFAQALSIAERMGDKRNGAIYLMNLGNSERCLGEYSEARAHFAEALTTARKLGMREVVVEVVYSVAFLAASAGDHERAGALLGAAQREGTFGHVLEYQDRVDYERTIGEIRRILGEDGLERAVAAGRSLSLDSVLMYLRADIGGSLGV